ncbi:MAG: leucyl/phenylalanyl-tRNA--protein transferase [Gammaproteobacteria bacterium]
MDETNLLWIRANKYKNGFPPLEEALTDPDGLLAAGGDLSSSRLLEAYRNGVFPWYDDEQPILWWSPDPRTVFYPEQIHLSRSLKKAIKHQPFNVTFDRAFERVIHECAIPRADGNGTWITSEMKAAYIKMHHEQSAHSLECWLDDKLVGGIYGVTIGQVFFGESMFSRVSNASKICLIKLAELLQSWNYNLIDCQVDSEHLRSMGAVQISRQDFKQLLDQYCNEAISIDAWKYYD